MKNFLLYLWQLPQNLLGWLLVKIYGAQKYSSRHTAVCKVDFWADVYATPKISGGVSLGKYIIVNENLVYDNTVKAHETGHCKQSCILGWLYLVVIGLPSGIWCWLYSPARFVISYYSFYTEAWADRLAGVKRK